MKIRSIFIIFFAFLSLLVTFYHVAVAEIFVSKSGKIKIEGYGAWSYTCRIGTEQVSYTIYDNQTDPEFAEACALTYDYLKCKTELKSNTGCHGAKWKEITKGKLLYISKLEKQSCFRKAKEMVLRLQSKKFICDEGGIN